MSTKALKPSRFSQTKRPDAFTLVELLVVIAIIAVLAGILLPTLAKSKARAQAVFCMNNSRQLALAWIMYADDHRGLLAYNLGNGPGVIGLTPGTPMSANWANNVLDWEVKNPDNTNEMKLVETGLGPYTAKAAAIYRCPSDYVLSDLQRYAGWRGRVRSYSMNAMVGDAGTFSTGGTNLNNPTYVQFFKMFTVPRPSDIFVFLDEHPDSIDDGYFLNKESVVPTWNDLPASYHDGAASFSFADGHSEHHRWQNTSTKQPARAYGINAPLPMPISDGPQDFSWVLSKMSIERSDGYPGTYYPH